MGLCISGRLTRDPRLGRHEAYLRSKAQQSLHLPLAAQSVTLEKDELLNIEWSYKVSYRRDPDSWILCLARSPLSDAIVQYSLAEALDLFQKSDLRIVDSWKAPHSEYRLWLLERPQIGFQMTTTTTTTTTSSTTTATAAHRVSNGTGGLDQVKGLPKWEEWLALWRVWDQSVIR